MKIKELIASTGKIGENRGKATVLSKKFGAIYLYNQMVTVQKFGTSITVSMMIGGVTDMVTSGGQRKPVAFHKVSLALNGIKQEYYKPEELVAKIRRDHPEYENEEEWKAPDVLRVAIDNPKMFFPGATLFRTTNDSDNGYSVVEDKIPEDAEIQVWCSCSDYYWTMQYYNCDNNVDLYNQYPQRYIPKTKKGFEAFKKGQPVRNPGRHPGMCKHLMLLLATLMDKGVVDDTGNGLKKYYKANYGNFDIKKKRLSMAEYEAKIKKYQADHDLKLEQRKIAHETMYGSGGYGKGWGMKWNQKAGQFRKRRS